MDVVNSTSSSKVLSECGITVTGFNFSIPNGRVCDNYTFTITPVNVVGNGTAVTLGYSQDFTCIADLIFMYSSANILYPSHTYLAPTTREELLIPISVESVMMAEGFRVFTYQMNMVCQKP